MATDTAATKASRVGIFGGAFDPVHRAHIALAQAAQLQFELDKVILVPSGNPPHRTSLAATGNDRLAMLRHATKNISALVVDDWELRQQCTTYTYDTLAHLDTSNAVELFFLMGEDSLHQFTSWRNWTGILDICHLGVAKRPGQKIFSLPKELEERVSEFGVDRQSRAGNIYFIDCEEMPVSATKIRSKLSAGLEPADLLDPVVMSYIRDNRLYQNA